MFEAEKLFHIAYVSRRGERVTDDEIVDKIVLPSMLRNRRLDLSGCIWFDSNFFLQVLEGVKKDLLGVYERIENDRRHHSIRVFSAQKIERRDFERFSMRLIGSKAPSAVHAIISRYEAGSEFRAVEHERVVECDEVVRSLITQISTELCS